MHLDITAYQSLKLIKTITNDNDDYINSQTGLIEKNIVKIHSRYNRWKQIYPLQVNATYRYQKEKYCLTISYTEYDLWRDRLAKVAGYPPVKSIDGERYDISAFSANEGKFYELIHFTDCDGVIGQQAIQKLLIDFNRQNIDDIEDIDNFKEKYSMIWDAFKFAKDDGLVQFHERI